jgi:PAS domain S-box-containing protein
MTMVLLTSGVVLLLTCAAFLAYEFLTYRQAAVQQLSTVGKIIAANSTAALAFDNPNDAQETLAALIAEPHIVAAMLYDGRGRPFARYPDHLSPGMVPATPAEDGYRFGGGRLIGVEPVVQSGNTRLGTLYLEADMGAMYERLQLYGAIAGLVVCVSFLVAYLVSRKLQHQISYPILALADAARAVSDRQDYSVRATKLGGDELGLLTDAFNQMLSRIQTQNQTLEESEGRNRAVVDSALDGIVAMNHEGLIVGFNPAAERIFGHRAGDVIGRALADVIIPPALRERHSRGLAHYLATGEGPVLGRRVELTGLRADGTEVPLEVSISRMPGAGQAMFTGFLRDITERKHAADRVQAQLARHDLLNRITRAIGERLDLTSIFQVVVRNLEDNLPIDFGCVCLHDPERQVLTVAAIGITGGPLAAALDLNEGTQIPIDHDGLSRSILGHLVYEPDISQSAFPFPQRLARQGLGALIVAPLLVESQVFGVLVAARREPHSFSSPDSEFLRQLSEHVALASHQAQIYASLQQAYNDLRQSQQTVLQQERLRALGQMASGIAHDINNAISPVALYTQSLLENEPNLSARARDYLETIERAIDDVAATVARMREFYRERGPQLALAPTDINTLVHQVLGLTRAWWTDLPQQRGVVIEARTELAPDLPALMGAEGEIREALTNLVFNAVDAMPEGGILTIRTTTTGRVITSGDESGQQVHVEVTDTGLGMDEETRRRCLEPFFTTKGERGTGLGLAMVYGMVQRHSGEIDIASAVGGGTTVRLSFVAHALPAGDSQPATAYAFPSNLRILVVDDDPLLLKSLRDTLEGDGHVIVTANGGREGIDAFGTANGGLESFAVVITDLGMPHVDGRQVASAVKRASPTTPVILLTGWGQRLLAEGDIPPHVDRVLSKPPKLRDLREALVYCSRLSQS